MAMFLVMTAERITPFLFFALYLITSFQICRYASWKNAGTPNPFLPRILKPAVREFEKRSRIQSFT